MKSFLNYIIESVQVNPYSKTYAPVKSFRKIIDKTNNKDLIDGFLSNYIHDKLKISETGFEISDIEVNKPIVITFKSFKDKDENDIKNLKITSDSLTRDRYIAFKIDGSELMKDNVQKKMLEDFKKDLEKDFNDMLKRIGFE